METSSTRSCPTRAVIAALGLVLLAAAAAVCARRCRSSRAETEPSAADAPAHPVAPTPVHPHDPVGLGMD